MVQIESVVDLVTMYARVLSDVLQAEIGISDMVPRYIAGTGPLHSKVGMDLEKEGQILRYVMQTKQPQIIPRPRHHSLCEACMSRGDCQESLEIAYPILTEGDKVLGVISIICYNDDQREHILSAQQTYMSLLHTFADLIALRAVEACKGTEDEEEEEDASDGEFNLEVIEQETIMRAMEAFDGDKRLVAHKLGIGIATLYRKLHKYGVVADKM